MKNLLVMLILVVPLQPFLVIPFLSLINQSVWIYYTSFYASFLCYNFYFAPNLVFLTAILYGHIFCFWVYLYIIYSFFVFTFCPQFSIMTCRSLHSVFGWVLGMILRVSWFWFLYLCKNLIILIQFCSIFVVSGFIYIYYLCLLFASSLVLWLIYKCTFGCLGGFQVWYLGSGRFWFLYFVNIS